MAEEIHSPLRDYRLIYRDKFAAAAEKAFEEFAATANIDIKSNSKTCQNIRHHQQQVDTIGKTIKGWWVLCIALWILAPASLGLWLTGTTTIFVPLAIIIVIALVELLFIHRKISSLSKQRKNSQGNKDKLIAQAYRQMEPLHGLYDDEIFLRLVNEVMPILHMDPYLKGTDMQVLTKEMGFRYNSSNKSAVMGIQSGKINGNPLIISRRLVHVMGSKTYTGSKRVNVRATRIINGKKESYITTENISASVTKPYPIFTPVTEVIYGNHAAPELTFSRKKNTFSNKEDSLSYKFTHWNLRRQAAKMDKDFALMTNEEFEVLFTTTDRSSNHQYSLLFTPIAQGSMIDLIRDIDKTGYGDDFNFHKNGRINTIEAEHMNEYDIYGTPAHLHQHEFEKAKQHFVSTTSETFRKLYFALAPLLSIPLYQQMYPQDYGKDASVQNNRCDTLEHEALAYIQGQTKFQHPQCVTNNILKTQTTYLSEGSTKVDVTAYGYRCVRRVDYERVRASDGSYHTVAIEWDEYLPAIGTGCFYLKEIQDSPNTNLTPIQRKDWIRQTLKTKPGSKLYHHILTWE